MAKNKNTAQVDEVDEVEELEELEVETEETKGTRPSDLAKELDIDPKSLRSFLRREFPRPAEDKNTSWFLTEAMCAKARDHFTPSDEDDEELEDE